MTADCKCAKVRHYFACKGQRDYARKTALRIVSLVGAQNPSLLHSTKVSVLL